MASINKLIKTVILLLLTGWFGSVQGQYLSLKSGLVQRLNVPHATTERHKFNAVVGVCFHQPVYKRFGILFGFESTPYKAVDTFAAVMCGVNGGSCMTPTFKFGTTFRKSNLFQIPVAVTFDALRFNNSSLRVVGGLNIRCDFFKNVTHYNNGTVAVDQGAKLSLGNLHVGSEYVVGLSQYVNMTVGAMLISDNLNLKSYYARAGYVKVGINFDVLHLHQDPDAPSPLPDDESR